MLMGHVLVLWEYELSTFRIKRVIETQASFSMTPKFRNFGRKNRIFAGIQKSKMLVSYGLCCDFCKIFALA